MNSVGAVLESTALDIWRLLGQNAVRVCEMAEGGEQVMYGYHSGKVCMVLGWEVCACEVYVDELWLDWEAYVSDVYGNVMELGIWEGRGGVV